MDFGNVPEWVSGVGTVGALVAAGIAARWAKRAAGYTGQQARAADEQVASAKHQLAIAQEQVGSAKRQLAIADEQLALARTEADRQQTENAAAKMALERSRLDALVPVVYGRAVLGSLPGWGEEPPLGLSIRTGPPYRWEKKPYSEEAVPGGLRGNLDGVAFTTSVGIELVNCSVVPALVEIVNPDRGELKLDTGQELSSDRPRSLFIPPHKTVRMQWTRTIGGGSLVDEEGVNRPEHCMFNLEYWIRDLGMNVHDTYRFIGDLRYFGRDGSLLTVKTELDYPWTQNIAYMVDKRVYERLEVEVEQEGGIGESGGDLGTAPTT